MTVQFQVDGVREPVTRLNQIFHVGELARIPFLPRYNSRRGIMNEQELLPLEGADDQELAKLKRIVSESQERRRRQGGKAITIEPKRCGKCSKWFLGSRKRQRFCSIECKTNNYGLSGTVEYICWKHMIARCTKKSEKAFPSYGGRGIKVCPRWLKSFGDFLADMGLRPSAKHTIERVNNNGNYEPGNCVWATRRDQSNNIRTNRVIEHQGERLTLAQWTAKLGFKRGFIVSRLDRGWTFEAAITVPKKPCSLWTNA